jgi:hypothetical protein
MKDFLQDIIVHTSPLEGVDLVKIVGTDTETGVTAFTEDKTIIMTGKFKNPLADFIGTFGMPNLSKLKTILSFEDYQSEDANISMVRVTKEGVAGIPNAIHFETKNGDFINDYRLMGQNLVEERVKNPKILVTLTYSVTFQPLVSGITRLKKQAQAHSEEKNFATKTENGDLKIYFGDPTTHSGNFVFESGVKGTLTKQLNWPAKAVIDILSLPGDKTVNIGDQGLMEIVVDSGLVVYSYKIPCQQK